MDTLALGIVTDEIASDIETAFSCGRQWGISRYELRCVGQGRVPFISEEDIRTIEGAIRNDGIIITALSPGVFKHTLLEDDAIERELRETLPQTIEMAKRFGAHMIIVFGFKREPGHGEELRVRAIDYMKRAAALAEGSDMVIAIENEPGFWCDTGERTARIIEAVDSPHLRANWDPANALGTDEVPFPDGYRALKHLIANVHVKDTIEGSLLKCVPVGEGRIEWKGQLKALLEDEPVAHITIETHCLPRIEMSGRNISTLKKMLNEVHHTD